MTSFKSGEALKTIYGSHVADLQKKYGTEKTLKQAISQVSDGKSRNELLNDFIFLIDTNYNFWEKNLYNKKAYADFGTDFTSATLNAVGGAVGAKAAKTTLSLIAGGLTGTKAEFNSDVLQNQNLLAIISKMRASRAEKLLTLQKGMYQGTISNPSTVPTSVDSYTIDQGMVDLVAYYEAGTFVNALQDIIDKAGKDKAKADSTSTKMKGIKGIPD